MEPTWYPPPPPPGEPIHLAEKMRAPPRDSLMTRLGDVADAFVEVVLRACEELGPDEVACLVALLASLAICFL